MGEDKRYLSQEETDRMIEKLTEQVQFRRYSIVIGIANGGLNISKKMALMLQLPHDSVRISHYDGEDNFHDEGYVENKIFLYINKRVV